MTWSPPTTNPWHDAEKALADLEVHLEAKDVDKAREAFRRFRVAQNNWTALMRGLLGEGRHDER